MINENLTNLEKELSLALEVIDRINRAPFPKGKGTLWSSKSKFQEIINSLLVRCGRNIQNHEE